jgi:hypothetical protein
MSLGWLQTGQRRIAAVDFARRRIDALPCREQTLK